MSRSNFCRWLPNGAVPDTRKACMMPPTCDCALNALARRYVPEDSIMMCFSGGLCGSLWL